MDGLNKRRSAVSAVHIPARKLKNSSPSPPPLQDVVNLMDYELVPLNFPSTSYMSLKDIIPGSPSSSILTPTPLAINSAVSSPPYGSGCEISIRNHLVKQAAWAYLQTAVPSSPSLSSSSSRRLCLSGEFFRSIMARFRKWSCEKVKYVYDWLVDVLWLILCR